MERERVAEGERGGGRGGGMGKWELMGEGRGGKRESAQGRGERKKKL